MISTAVSLPYMNALLFTLQLLLNANQDAYSPTTPPNTTHDIPLAPAGYAFLIWLVIYVFTAVHVFFDCFYREHSIYETTDNPTALRLCFTASCGFNMAWIVLNNWLQWINVGTLDLMLLTLSLLPIYVFIYSEELTHKTQPPNWRRYWGSAFAIRLYFSWSCAATLMCLTASLQDLSGAYLSFETYAILLAVLFVIALCGIVYGNDPVIGLVVTWALVGIIKRANSTPLDLSTQHTVELLQACATLAAPILPAMILISCIHKRILSRPQTLGPIVAVEMAKRTSSYLPRDGYGTTNA